MEKNKPEEQKLRNTCVEAASVLGRDLPAFFSGPPGPLLLKPAEGATLENGAIDRRKQRVWEFSWAAVPGAGKYHLHVIGAKATLPIIDKELTSPSFRFTSVGYVGGGNRLNWRWKVRAFVDGKWTKWSRERKFHVALLKGEAPGPATKKGRDN